MISIPEAPAIVTQAAELFRDGALTIEQIRQQYGVGRTTVYRWMTEGRLAYTTVHGRRLVPRKALMELLASGLDHAEK